MDTIVKIVQFSKHVDKSVEQLMDEIDHTGNGYDDKYDLHLEMNGQKLTLDMNADTYCRLSNFLVDEVKEFAALYNHYDRIRPLAAAQMNMQVPEELLITFEYFKTHVTDPFMGITGTEEVNPVEYYGKAFMQSDWFNEEKITKLEALFNV